MTELSEREKIKIEINITCIYVVVVVLIGAVVLVMSRHVSWSPSWQKWEPDDWIAFCAAMLLLGLVLNYFRMISIKDTIKRMESDRSIFSIRKKREEKINKEKEERQKRETHGGKNNDE